ncbi:[citrate [pro-3S]-lyase] ligase [Lactiplantibacillus fabifermentans T30PCM01]|uniref:[citrate [pro-3S]-lyase] ligase n=1 Tax=Lactiplantibacillus fabifermentans T30PCM01 TaxID=1400520 RepID=W6TD50_9LACO|nr:[citrate (pro-3S)-lyase] ligase [Lactiplantibacillus fabifermentans]ETY75365.1 [citrate [pro-3S]-lyase] ligase [Lactiplantibacillus fabifermentans T30PCM01]
MQLKRLWLTINPTAKQQWQALLTQAGLMADGQVDYTVGLYEHEQLIGTGSLYQNIIKCVAIDETVTHQNLLAPLIKALLDRLAETPYDNAFVYTKPCTAPYFEALGFKAVVATKQIVLLERGYPDLNAYQLLLDQHKVTSTNAGAIVMNANPFTNGHLHLIKTALKTCDVVYVFVVSEDRSQFDTQARLTMVQQAVAAEPRVIVLPTNHYLVANATFPAYFLKDHADLAVAKQQAQLDATLFLRKISPILDIHHRFVGEEPLSPVTQVYNEQLAKVLTGQVALTVVPRLQYHGQPVSATAVRAAIAANEWSTVDQLVPPTTRQFLKGS